MRSVLPALATELTELQTLCSRLLVLGRRVVPVFALTALQLNNFPWHKNLSLSSWATATFAEAKDLGGLRAAP
jgi:hypothetical protein